MLAESRTLKGGGAAGVATIGAAGLEVAQEVLAETQGAIMPLVPYVDTLRWLFIATALAGIAVAIYARLDDWKTGPAGIDARPACAWRLDVCPPASRAGDAGRSSARRLRRRSTSGRQISGVTCSLMPRRIFP